MQWADALTHGYATAFTVGTVMMVIALVLTLALMNAPKQAPVAGSAVHAG
jgi:hypothetical protein